MARSGEVVDETIAIGTDAGDATRRVLQVITAARSHQIVVAGPTSYRLVRRYRPAWAVPLMFVKTAEECALSVTTDEDARGARTLLRLAGRLPRTTLTAVRLVAEPMPAAGGARPQRAARHAAAPAPPPASASTVHARDTSVAAHAAPPATYSVGRASPPASDIEDPMNGTVPRQARTSAARAGSSWSVVFDTGDQVPLEGLVLVGRDPAYAAGESGRLVPIVDPDFSISKTHVALGVDDGGVWVIDRNSLNGTAIARSDGDVICPPGQRIYIQPGESVFFGERTFTIHAHQTRPA